MKPAKLTKLPESASVKKSDKRLTASICVLLVLAVFVVFGQTLNYEFVNYDDDDQVYEHPVIKNGLSVQGIVWVFTHSDDGHWIPLNKISHMLDCQLYGLKPGGHHLTNVLLHAATAILLFLILQRMTAAAWRSAFVAIVFAIHPLRVESVAWVSERKDILSGFFFMLTLWAYIRYVRRAEISGQRSAMKKLPNGPQPLTSVDYWLALLFFACGLMSKAMVATLPLLLLLLDFWPLNRFLRPVPVAAIDKKKQMSVFKWLILEKIPFLGLIIAAGIGLLFSRDRNNVVVAEALKTGQGLVPHRDFSLMVRTGHALLAPLVYLKQMLFPAGLAVFYTTSQSVPRLEMFVTVILLLVISVTVLARWRRQPYLVVGWFWYLIMLAPVIILIQKGAEVRSDRYTYLPQIGVYILLTWAAADLCAGWRHRRILGVGAFSVIVALMICAWKQTTYWRNSDTLWSHTLAYTSDSPLAQNNFGDALLEQGNVTEAIAHFQMALQIKPDYAEALNNLGQALLQKGNVDEAISRYQKSLQIKPSFAMAHYNLGNALFRKGDVDEAIAQFQQALQINPYYAEAHNNFGNALLQKGNVDEAITQFQETLQIKPDFAEALNNLGNALLQKGNVDEAIVHFQQVLQINPSLAEAHNNLGNALLQRGDADGALAQFQQALQINPNYAEAHYNFGNTLLQKGKVDEAISHYQQALQINPGYAKAHNNLGSVLLQKGIVDEAIVHDQKALQINPDFAEAHNNLANALLQKGNVDEAISHYQKAVQIEPDFVGALNNLAWVLATSPQASLRNGNKAVELAQRADQLTGDGNPVVLCTLAAAYAQTGRFPEAVETAQRALRPAEAQSNTALADVIQSQIKLYQAGIPFRSN
jgi:protein O-mannosyl-transferase